MVSHRYCGKSVPPSLTSSTNALMLVFVADSDLAYEGFLINYEAIDVSAGNKTASSPWYQLGSLQDSTMRILYL